MDQCMVSARTVMITVKNIMIGAYINQTLHTYYILYHKHYYEIVNWYDVGSKFSNVSKKRHFDRYQVRPFQHKWHMDQCMVSARTVMITVKNIMIGAYINQTLHTYYILYHKHYYEIVNWYDVGSKFKKWHFDRYQVIGLSTWTYKLMAWEMPPGRYEKQTLNQVHIILCIILQTKCWNIELIRCEEHI